MIAMAIQSEEDSKSNESIAMLNNKNKHMEFHLDYKDSKISKCSDRFKEMFIEFFVNKVKELERLDSQNNSTSDEPEGILTIKPVNEDGGELQILWYESRGILAISHGRAYRLNNQLKGDLRKIFESEREGTKKPVAAPPSPPPPK